MKYWIRVDGRRVRPPFIYFIGTYKHVKIGYTLGDPLTRFRSVQTNNPELCTLMAVFEGNKADELAWHVRFEHLFIRGEWFKRAYPIEAAISEESHRLVRIDAEVRPRLTKAARIETRRNRLVTASVVFGDQ